MREKVTERGERAHLHKNKLLMYSDLLIFRLPFSFFCLRQKKNNRKEYNYFEYVISKISSLYWMLWHVHVPQNKSANQWMNVCTYCVLSWDLFPSLLKQEPVHKQMTGRVENMKKIMFNNCLKWSKHVFSLTFSKRNKNRIKPIRKLHT